MAVLEANKHMHRFRFASFDGKEDAEEMAQKPATAAAAENQQLQPTAPLGPTIPLPLVLPAITEADVQAARSEAQANGYREGYAAAQAKFKKETDTREDAVKSLLEVISNRITLAAETHMQVIKEREALMGKLVMAAARKVAGDALKREPYAAIESLLRDCMGLIAGAPKLTVVVSSALAQGLRQRIDTLRPMLIGFNGELYVEEDEALLDQDCRVEWSNGYGERNAEALWSALEAIIVKTNINT